MAFDTFGWWHGNLPAPTIDVHQQILVARQPGEGDFGRVSGLHRNHDCQEPVRMGSADPPLFRQHKLRLVGLVKTDRGDKRFHRFSHFINDSDRGRNLHKPGRCLRRCHRRDRAKLGKCFNHSGLIQTHGQPLNRRFFPFTTCGDDCPAGKDHEPAASNVPHFKSHFVRNRVPECWLCGFEAPKATAVILMPRQTDALTRQSNRRTSANPRDDWPQRVEQLY